MVRQVQLDYKSALICNIKTRPRIYNYIKWLKITATLLGKSNGVLAENYTEVAECFAKLFNSVFIDLLMKIFLFLKSQIFLQDLSNVFI